MQYEYYINLDERGDFFADVRNKKNKTVFEIHGFDIFEDGFLKHKNDLDGLLSYLIDMGICKKTDTIIKAN